MHWTAELTSMNRFKEKMYSAANKKLNNIPRVMCEYHDIFLANDSRYSIVSHIFSTIGLPIHIFGFYCIIKKTPKEMSSIKFSMLLLHVSCFISDTIFGAFIIPVIFLPYFCGYSMGLLNYFGIPMWIQIYFGITTSTS
ncbi:unnamed protein product [Caenorhabditis angaria]|uniref:Uncharacterized protein n=1 Tax=Caenorhabditis angaria TaxID=860376 RepID=A0A9P1N723_9PELO|nr:unnamed protein product [Caenorhabditis angaria]